MQIYEIKDSCTIFVRCKYVISMDTSEKAPILISLENVDIVKEQSLILSRVSMQIFAGEWVYMVGRVGSGKTSIIKTLIGEIPVYNGLARVLDFDLCGLKRRQIPFLRRKIGVVFQDFQLLMDRSVYENLAFVLKATGSPSKAIAFKIEEALYKVGMAHKKHKMPHQLSGGEQQRVAIARALLHNPQLILADEPTGNLDAETAAEVLSIFSELHKSQGKTIVMVTHNRALIQRFPGRLFRCEGGRCSELDTQQEIDFSGFEDEFGLS